MICPTPTSPDNFGDSFAAPPELIVIHGTGLAHDATAEAEIRYMRRPGIGVSYHYYVDKDGLLSQLVPETHVAWHAGVSRWSQVEAAQRQVPWHDSGVWEGLNAHAIGIGLESHNDADELYPWAQQEAARWLCRGLMLRYDIPPWRVLTHAMVSAPRKVDPVNWNHRDFIFGL